MTVERLLVVARGPRRRTPKAGYIESDKGDRLVMLGKNLQAARLAQNLTQRQVASAAGVKHQYISLIERGRANLTMESMERLSAALGVDVADLLRKNRNT